MSHVVHIKNMVCNRCIATVLQECNSLDLTIKSIELGQVEFDSVVTDEKLFDLEKALTNHGFEVIKEELHTFIESVKMALIKRIELDIDNNISTYLSNKLGKSYTVISKTFSKSEGVTIEKYDIHLRIEKAKELIQLSELNFSEIAYALGYRSSSHLATQFKSVTGMSMSRYKTLQHWDRKSMDKII